MCLYSKDCVFQKSLTLFQRNFFKIFELLRKRLLLLILHLSLQLSFNSLILSYDGFHLRMSFKVVPGRPQYLNESNLYGPD